MKTLFEVNYPNGTPQNPSRLEVFAENEKEAIEIAAKQRPSNFLYRGPYGGTFAAGEAVVNNIVWDDEIGQVHPKPGAYKIELLLDRKYLKTARMTVTVIDTI